MDPRIEVEAARRYLVDGWQSFNKMAGNSWAAERYREYDQFKENLGNWQTLPDRILTASPHLQGISGHERRLDELLQTMPLLDALEIIDQEFG